MRGLRRTRRFEDSHENPNLSNWAELLELLFYIYCDENCAQFGKKKDRFPELNWRDFEISWLVDWLFCDVASKWSEQAEPRKLGLGYDVDKLRDGARGNGNSYREIKVGLLKLSWEQDDSMIVF